MTSFVKVVPGKQHEENAYVAIAAVCTEPLEGKKVLLKVNTGFKGKARTGLCTNPDVVAGLIRFFKDRGA